MTLRTWMCFLLILSPVVGSAQNDFSFSDDTSFQTSSYQKMTPALYEAEGLISFYNMGRMSSPSVGASLSREIFQDGFIGFRTMLPWRDEFRANLYSIEAMGRYFLRASEIKVYTEITLGIAGLSGYREESLAQQHFPILGAGVGMQYPIAPGATIGGQLGATMTTIGINNGLGLMPTLAMTSSIKF